MYADINTEGYLRIYSRDHTTSYALRVYFEKSPADSGMVLSRDGVCSTLEIPEGYPKVRKQKVVK